MLKYCVKFALFKTGHALDTFFLVDAGNLFLLPGYGIHRTAAKAKTAFGAHFRFYFKPQEFNAAFGRTTFFKDVRFVFIPEIPQG
jgi:hypothetical protein